MARVSTVNQSSTVVSTVIYYDTVETTVLFYSGHPNFPIQILSVRHAALHRILANVFLQIQKLFFAPHEMIEWFTLPQIARTPDELVDLACRVSLNFPELLSQIITVSHLNQNVDVIGHRIGEPKGNKCQRASLISMRKVAN